MLGKGTLTFLVTDVQMPFRSKMKTWTKSLAFLVACKRLYNPLSPSVCWSVDLLVRQTFVFSAFTGGFCFTASAQMHSLPFRSLPLPTSTRLSRVSGLVAMYYAECFPFQCIFAQKKRLHLLCDPKASYF